MKVFITRWVLSKGIQEHDVNVLDNGMAQDSTRPTLLFEIHEWHKTKPEALERAVKVIEAEENGKKKSLRILDDVKLDLLAELRSLTMIGTHV
jgi:hypothetical protein